MHDPMVVAHEIRRPYPVIRRKTHNFNNERRWAVRASWAKWYKPWQGWSCFWKFGNVELYWPSFITVWHVEPQGHDSGEVCKHSTRWQDDDGKWHSKARHAWKWHVHHWRIQLAPWQSFRRWALTSCEWCGGPSRKGDVVNLSGSWDRDKTAWWRGERGLFHHDCYSIREAHMACLCEDGLYESELAGWGYGTCLLCGKRREWRSVERQENDAPIDASRRILATIPAGKRDFEKTAEVHALWAAHRAATEENR